MIVITGGAGFIGSAFLSKLNQMNITDILVVDESDISEKGNNLKGKHFVDYLDKDKFIDKLENNNFSSIDAIIHLGANSSTTENNIKQLKENNYRYTWRLARWSVSNNTRFIYASSAATYGDGELGFSDEKDEITIQLRPLNAYGLSKQLFDLWAIDNNLFDRIVGIKFFNVFGPNEYHKGDMRSLICKGYYQIQKKGVIRLFKSYKSDFENGGQRRDFIYIKDCNEVLWWLLNNPCVNGLFNLGTGKSRSWNDLVKAIFTALNLPAKIEYIEMPQVIREAYQYHTEATMSKLRMVGYKSDFYSLEEAIIDYVLNYLHPKLQYL